MLLISNILEFPRRITANAESFHISNFQCNIKIAQSNLPEYKIYRVSKSLKNIHPIKALKAICSPYSSNAFRY